MEVVTVDPKKCSRWKLGDRSGFEFGDIHTLAQDILKNGQIEPVILRKSTDKEDHFDVIAGSRRWRACFEEDIPLKALSKNLPILKPRLIKVSVVTQQDLYVY